MTMPVLANISSPNACPDNPRAGREVSETEDRANFDRILRKKEEEKCAEELACATAAAARPVETPAATPEVSAGQAVEAAGLTVSTNTAPLPQTSTPTMPLAPPPAVLDGDITPPAAQGTTLDPVAEHLAVAAPAEDSDHLAQGATAAPETATAQGDTASSTAQQPAIPAPVPATAEPTAKQPNETETTTEPLAKPASRKAIETVQLERLSDITKEPAGTAPVHSMPAVEHTAPASATFEPITTPNDASNRAAEINTQVTRALEQMEQAGKGTLRLQLRPAELGAIDIRLVSRLDGLRVIMIAENAATSRMLEAQVDHLRETLANSGIALNQVNIQQQSQHDPTPWREPQYAQTPDRQTGSAKPQAEPEPAPARAGRTRSGSVDYRI